MAVITTGVAEATAPAVIVNFAEFVPAVTVTFGGTVSAGSEEESMTSAPPAGEGPLSETPGAAELAPDTRDAGTPVTAVRAGGTTERFPDLVTPA